MLIDLPRKFRYSGGRDDYAEVKDGILHIYGSMCFRKVIHSLTFTLKGKKKCYYCGKLMKDKEVSVDHMYSQRMGGPTIPNNLVPCCGDCNSKKSNMSTEQYLIYRELQRKQKEEYRRSINIQQRIVIKSGAYELPAGWVTYQNIGKFIVRVELDQRYKGRKYDRVKAWYKEYGFIQKPILVDKKNFVLDGYITLMFCKEQGIEKVPVIVLENVEYHF